MRVITSYNRSSCLPLSKQSRFLWQQFAYEQDLGQVARIARTRTYREDTLFHFAVQGDAQDCDDSQLNQD